MSTETTMGGLDILVTVSLCTTVIGTASSQDRNQTEAMRKLEETVSYLQKQMLAKEQEQKLVLSDMISKWIMTTDQLNKLQQKYTVLENAQNSTSVDGAGKCFTGLGVAFEAHMAGKIEHSHSKEFKANSNLIFSDTKYNEGGCWNSSNSVFTAPINGTYMFWMNLSVRDDHSSPFTVAMKRNEVEFDKIMRSDDDEDSSHLSLISLTALVQGDLVKFVADQTVKYWASTSSCGGVLLH